MASVVVQGVTVAVVALHCAASGQCSAERCRQIRVAVRSARLEASTCVVLGDMNLRDRELHQMQDANAKDGPLDVEEAPYEGATWHPTMNQYYEPVDARLIRAPMRFDRVLVAGSVYGCAYLVGMRKQFVDGQAFYLSDHFAVLALLDLNPMHDARDASKKAVLARRAAVVRLRDEASRVERQECVEASRLGKEQAAVLRQRAAEEERAQVLKRHQQELKTKALWRKRLEERAFGAATLCSAHALGRGQAPSAVPLEALHGCRGGDVRQRLLTPASSAESEANVKIGGLFNVGNTCFANSVLQVLLRLPAFSLWLSEHQFCEDGSGACVLCALRATRGQLSPVRIPVPILVERMRLKALSLIHI